MSLISDEDKNTLRDVFSKKLGGSVKLVAFTKKDNCEYCNEIVELMKEVSSLDQRISYEVYDFDEAAEKRGEYSVEMAPALVISGAKSSKVHFYGLPAGYEFSAFVDDMIDISKDSTRLAPSTVSKLGTVDKDVKIQVFVTPSCPYCPRAVRMAHQFAMANGHIDGSMVEALEFEDLANEYGVMSVPHIVINGSYTFIGAVPETQFLNYLFDALQGKQGPTEGGEVSSV
ncbi:MAG: thioredoxin family protein [Nitrososphaerota archaeon]|jgi:glutaredoxin-like protein|nr:thioredoxin family protein [Nitrososphaerota archaeon]MDG6936081.1 thioredoxin family protein [Nitrososphaerota archaeon]MDG6943725.1 thioredoxin family protein [Nitrososphaerota archaeon]